jgi:hypothetical protein
MTISICDALNPQTEEIEKALFLHDYFGKHNHGIRFLSDGLNAPRYCTHEIVHSMPTKEN